VCARGAGMSAGATLIWQRMFLATAVMRLDRQTAKCSGNSAHQSDKPRVWRTRARRDVHIIVRPSEYVGMHVSPHPLAAPLCRGRKQKAKVPPRLALSLLPSRCAQPPLRASCASLARSRLALPAPSPEPAPWPRLRSPRACAAQAYGSRNAVTFFRPHKVVRAAPVLRNGVGAGRGWRSTGKQR